LWFNQLSAEKTHSFMNIGHLKIFDEL